MKRAALLYLALAACPGPAPSTCPPRPMTCPSPAPSYASVIGPLLQQKCQPCHYRGNPFYPVYFESYQDAVTFQINALGQLESCLMPRTNGGEPDGAVAPMLSDPDRATLEAWFGPCNAPNN